MEDKRARRMTPLKWLLFAVFLVVVAALILLMAVPHNNVLPQ